MMNIPRAHRWNPVAKRVGVCVLLLASLAVVGSMGPNGIHVPGSLTGADIDALEATARVMESIYGSTGRIVPSLDAVEQTAYYPFRESWRTPCSGKGTFRLELRTEGLLDWNAIATWQHGSDDMRYVISCFDSLPPQELTRRAEALYLRGVKGRLHALAGSRQSIRAAYESMALESVVPPQLTERVVEKPSITGDLPLDGAELRDYVEWLKAIEGVSVLADGWGRPLVFRLEHDHLVCRSAGADGVFPSRDDVMTEVPVRQDARPASP